MGESKAGVLRLYIDRRLKPEFYGSKVTSDAAGLSGNGGQGWSRVVKIGAKVVRHGRYVTFQSAEAAVPRDLFRKILSLIDDLRRRPVPA